MTAAVEAPLLEQLDADDRPLVGGGLRVSAHLVLGASLSLALASLVLVVLNRPEWTSDQWYYVVDVADAVVYGVVAWALLARIQHPVAWLVALTAVGGGLAALGAQWFQYHLAHPDTPALDLLSSMSALGWVPGTLALMVGVPWRVRDDELDRGARGAVACGAAVIAWFMATRLTDPFPWPEGDPFMPLPVRSERWAGAVEAMTPWQMGAVVLLGLVASADVLRRWSGRGLEDRRGLGWLAIATAVMSLSFLPLALPAAIAEHLPVAFTPVLHLASQAFFPGAILVVVLGQRLWGIDLAVSRMLVWTLMTAALTVAYVVVVTLLTTLLPVRDGILQVVATAFVAAGFQPAKVWVQGRVNRLVHGDAGEPLRVVRRVGRRLGTGAAQGLLEDVALGVMSALRLGGVAVVGEAPAERREGAGPAGEGSVGVLCSVGRTDGDGVEVPLVVHRVEVGRLVARPRPGERLDARSRRSLEELAPIVAATVELSGATQALEESRARLAAARDEERRYLRRELHDGLGPALAGLGLTLRAGSNLMDREPARARQLVERAAAELDERVEEVRGMARGLIPPVLDELGLLPALRDLAELHHASGLRVDLDVDDLPDLAPEASVAVYGIVAEAVRNVVRHAAADRCTIRVRVDESAGTLVLEVVDDGVGIPAQPPRGVGLSSMRERAEGLGGTLTVEGRSHGGTRVTATLPLGTVAR